MVVARYGSWRSPITSQALVERVVRLGDIRVGGARAARRSGEPGDDVWWNESRPAEGGRQVVVHRSPDGLIADAIPAGFSARTTVHEYGGAAYAVDAARVYFSNFDDQRLWVFDGETEPVPLTPEAPEPLAWRYADARVVSASGSAAPPAASWLVCVRERHGLAGEGEVVNDLVAVPTGGGDPVSLAGGHDFFAAPRPNPDGTRLAWLAWDHPNMPWNGTELWVADISARAGTPPARPPRLGGAPTPPGAAVPSARAGTPPARPPRLGGAPTPPGAVESIWLESARRVAGGPAESVSQPRWSPDGRLHWISDRSGWWNLYADDAPGGRPIAPRPAEFGRPDWVFGQSTYAFLPDGRLMAVWSQHGIDRLMAIDTASGAIEPISTAYTAIESVQAWRGGVVALAGSPTEDPAIVALAPSGRSQVLRRSRDAPVDPASVSEAQPVEFPTTGGLTAHAFYYPPANPGFDGPRGERPPLLVMSHGGPTSATSSALDLRIQFWTTRGIAVVDVNYGGSSGYGRAYRERLEGNWGVVDVDDCVNAALYLAEQGHVDRDRLAMRGSSAGGYTTLCALAFRDVFAAGAASYGVADLEALAAHTHKFESRYLDRLVGPYPGAREVYRERSPIHFADRMSCPIVLLQGTEDEVVPPEQSEVMVSALRAAGLPFAYVTFAGEQHGFRRAESIRRAIEVELSFFAEVLDFQPADDVEPVEIHNFATRGSRGPRT